MSLISALPWVILALLLTGGGSLVFGYVKGEANAKASYAAQVAQEKKLIDQAVDAMENSTAQAISKIEVKHVTIRQALQKEVVDRPVYRECGNTPDGLRLINSAITGADTAIGVGGDKLPGAGTADRR